MCFAGTDYSDLHKPPKERGGKKNAVISIIIKILQHKLSGHQAHILLHISSSQLSDVPLSFNI